MERQEFSIPTIKEIAKQSGVSIATVSNIINNKPGASEETRKRVKKIIEQLNYTPNSIAKNLKQRTTRTIGIITEDLTIFNTPNMVDAIHEYCNSRCYDFILGNLRLFQEYSDRFYDSEDYFQKVFEEFRLMKSKQVEGIIYVSCHCREFHCIPDDFGIPIVLAYGISNQPAIPSILYDDQSAAQEATHHLVKAGHRHIALISGRPDSHHTRLRLLGFQKELYEAKIPFNPDDIIYGNWNGSVSFEEIERILSHGVTAFFAMNDMMAGTLYDYAADKGFTIGKDFSVIGFDNREISQAYRPQLSTMNVPLAKIGHQAAKTLLDMLEHPWTELPDKPVIFQLNCNYIQRNSVGPPVV